MADTFDIEGARKEGYTDDEISDYLAKQQGFDIAGARNEGYSTAEILSHLTGQPLKPKAPTPPGVSLPTMPAMEHSKLGGAYETGKEILTQLGGLATGVSEMLWNPGAITAEVATGQRPNPITAPLSAAKQEFFGPGNKPPAQRFIDAVTSLVGGSPEEGRKIYAETGSPSAAVAAYLTNPIAGLLLGAGMSRAKVPNITTRDMVNSSTALIDPGAIRPTFDPLKASGISIETLPKDIDVMSGVAMLNRPNKLAAMKRLNIDPKVFATTETGTAADVMGNIKRGGKAAIDIVNEAVKIAQEPIDATIRNYVDRRVPTVQNSIVSDLKAEAENFAGVDDAISRALNRLADDVAGNKGSTVGGLNGLKVHANQEIGSLIRGSTGKQMEASAHASYAYRVLGDSIRQHLYPAVEQMGGVKLSEYGARESAAIIERDGVAATYFQRVVPEQANRATMSYIQKVIGGSLYKSHVARRALGMEQLPMARFNDLFRRGMGDMGTFTPETVTSSTIPSSPVPANRMLTSGSEFSPTGKFQFSIPSEGVMENLESISVKPSEMRYTGTREVPNPRHEPIGPKPPVEGTSHYRQRQQYGSAVETIPERARGTMTPSKARADQLGSSQAAIPSRSFTGPETTTESTWVYMEPPELPSSLGTRGPGILMTEDPAVAIKTLADINDMLQNPKLPDTTRAQLLSAQQTLQTQLQQYSAYNHIQPPPGMKVNITPANLGTRPLGKGFRNTSLSSGAVGVAKKREK